MALQELDLLFKDNKTAEHCNGHSHFVIYFKKKNQVVYNSVKCCLGVAIGTFGRIVDQTLTAVCDVFGAL